MKRNEILKRILVWLIGITVLQIGVALFLSLGLGSDAFTVFTQGIASKLAISPGTANRLLTFVFLGIIFILDRKQIRIGTFLAIVSTGIILDGILKLIEPFNIENYHVIVRMVILIAACIIICIGFPILKSSELGVAPNDLIYLAIMKKFKKSYTSIRMSIDGLYLIFGGILGGVIGIGTIVCLGLLGPLMDMFFPKIESLVNAFIDTSQESNEKVPNNHI